MQGPYNQISGDSIGAEMRLHILMHLDLNGPNTNLHLHE